MEYKDKFGQPLQVGDIITTDGPSSKDKDLFPVLFRITKLGTGNIWGDIRAKAIHKVDLLKTKGLCSEGNCNGHNVIRLEKEMASWEPEALKLHLKLIGMEFPDE